MASFKIKKGKRNGRITSWTGGEDNMLLKLFNALLVFVVAFIVLSVVIALLGALNIAIASTIAGILSPFVLAIAILLGVISFFGGLPANWNLIK